MKAYEQTLTYLSTLKLKGIATGLDEIINDAEITCLQQRYLIE